MKKIIITGGSGFLGTQIAQKLLEDQNNHIVVMDIAPPRFSHKRMTFVQKNLLEPFGDDKYPELQNPHAVIHLSGKSIYGRFTKKHKQLVYDTRVLGTRHLVDLFARDDCRPEYFTSASAVGFYGDQPGVTLDEDSARSNYYFLSDVVHAWEAEALRAEEFGVQTTCIRNGHIIGQGGILAEVGKTFTFGVGGILGTGREYMPWIDVRDLVDLYILTTNQVTPVIINGVSNTTETQGDFSRAIGKTKNTKFYMHVYEWMLWLKFGGFAQEMLVDQKVLSKNLEKTDFKPKYTDIIQVIRFYLQKT